MLGTDQENEFCDHFYAPNTLWPKVIQNFVRLPEFYSFDLASALVEFERVRKRYALRPFTVRAKTGAERRRLSYRGLGLSARPAVEEPLYDALHLYGSGGAKLDIYQTFAQVSEKLPASERVVETLVEDEFTELTEACTPFFQAIIRKFRAPFTKVRFLELMPGGFIPPHVDFPYYQGIRLHAVLTSNEDVWWEVAGERFQLPCDGHFYWFDTGKYHAVVNRGQTPRVVLSINLQPYKNAGAGQAGCDLLGLFKQCLV